ncbi:hypothetical protein ADIWIN_2721 [Winogradskyella psychrotolerans RS-3]|uniref:Uncharacterized protein n=1 Tax=Winogradskyella psychrotolerans RS-3 TaxID=641526 RepID=S7VQI3_9FLAO|nr:hypothetical protein [Winogradskyella psychrotolerans]EPR72221.1 hypothetical protein ADIWIN_2721 [Winogradskyella psychrotolerans RS-3]
MNKNHKLEILTSEKIKRNFKLIKSSYFSEIIYDENRRFFDLYFNVGTKGILENQTKTYNELIENLNEYLTKISEYLKSTYTNSEKKKAAELNQKKLNISVVQISDKNKDFDTVIVCEKEYKYFGIFTKNIGIRTEIKNGRITTMERKADTLKENLK